MQTQIQGAIHIHPLFVALTKPTMYAGVTLTYFIINGLINLILFIASSSLLPLIIVFPLVHMVGYLCCLHDARMFDLLVGKLQYSHCPNHWFWGCNSYEPY